MNQDGFLIVENRIKEQKEICLWLLTMLSALGTMGVVLMTFVENPIWWLMVLMLVLSMVVLAWPQRRIRRLLFWGAMIALVCYLTILGGLFRSGVLQLANNMIALYNYNTGSELYYYVIPQEWDENLAFQVFMCLLTVIIVTCLYGLLKQKRVGVFVLANLLVVILSIFFKNQQALVMCVFCCMAIPAAIMWSQAKEERTLFIFMSVGLLCGSVISFGYMLGGEYQSNLTVAKIKSAMVQQADAMRYGEIDAPQGDLGKAASFSGGEMERLCVTASSPEMFYLKGYVGGEYKENTWRDIDMTHYAGEYEGMFDWMSKRNFYPMSQNSSYITLLKNDNGIGITSKTVDVTLENVGANEKYMYIPYGLHTDDIQLLPQMNKDLNVYAEDTDVVTFHVDTYDTATAFALENPGWMNTAEATEESASFRDAQVEYRTFVYENYLDIEENYKVYFDRELKGVNLNGYVTITNKIREWLEDEKTLSDTLETNDYLLYFMERTKKGNSCYYASAATLMYRYFGIPARYVEGYLADLRDVEENVQGYQKMLTGQDVHAWVEIYKDGIGWIPVEVTPGFYSELEMQQQSVVRQEIQQEEEMEEEREKKRKVRYENITDELVTAVVSIFVVVLLGLIIRRKVICCIRICKLSGAREGQITTIIRFIKQLLQFSNQTEETMPEDVTDILRKYRFYERGISEEEYAVLKGYAYNMQQSIFRAQDRKGKMRMQYIWALI